MTTLTRTLLVSAITALFAAGTASAQMNGHDGHDMKQMDHSKMDHSKMEHQNMDHDAMMKARAAHMIEATAIVTKINKKDGLISLKHSAIPAISWPPMTMKFPAGQSINLGDFKKGQSVQFTLHRANDGTFPLVELCGTSSSSVIAGLCAPGMNHGPKAEGHGNKPHAHGDH